MASLNTEMKEVGERGTLDAKSVMFIVVTAVVQQWIKVDQYPHN